MDSKGNNGAHKPLTDLTNTTIGDDQSGSSTHAKIDESRQRRRERDKARWATMTQEERNEKKKKRREAYHLRKEKNKHVGGLRGGVDSNKENMPMIENNDWLHRNDSFQPLQRNEQVTDGGADKIKIKEQKKSYSKQWYANLTPTRKEAHKESSKLYGRWRREVQKHTLNKESIAMENPLFVPQLMGPTVESSSGPYGTAPNSDEWVIPEASATPLFMQSAGVAVTTDIGSESTIEGTCNVYTSLEDYNTPQRILAGPNVRNGSDHAQHSRATVTPEKMQPKRGRQMVTNTSPKRKKATKMSKKE